jgi:hypothetical protein
LSESFAKLNNFLNLVNLLEIGQYEIPYHDRDRIKNNLIELTKTIHFQVSLIVANLTLPKYPDRFYIPIHYQPIK